VRRTERGLQVETSGFQPVPEDVGGFAAGPAPVPPAETEEAPAAGWTYSYLADPAVPLADEPRVEPPVSAVPADVPPADPLPAYDQLGSPAPVEVAAYQPSALDAPSAEAPLSYEPPAASDAAPAVDAVGLAPVVDIPAQPSYQPALPVPDVAAAAPVLPPAPNFKGDAVGLVPNENSVRIADSEAAESSYQRATTEAETDENDIVLNDLLMHVLDTGASDLHLTSGARPSIRLNGELRQLEEHPILTPPVIQRVIYAALTQKQREKFEENLELDFAYSVPGRARFRVNVYRQRDALGAAFRIIPFEIRKLEDLGVPPSVANFASLPRGFVLVTGPTGSGKSTTLASIIDLANRTRNEHIMTVEDPIEFLHRHQRCIVNQREVGEDTWSFQNALKHVLRQDPDIILVGEMRDLETISVALTAAETGHLVFATLHTQDAAQTIDRIIDVFPTNQQQQVRVQLAGSLQGVVCQTLAKTRDGHGRAVATEVLVATPAIRNLIREGKTHQIYSAMQAGAKHGMHTMDQHLADLVMKGRITYETGLEKCHHVEDFNRLAGRG
jgi:twitching motility protein PilT